MLENLTAVNLILLGVAMFASGFIDAIAGGGGLIQTPAMLLSFPDRNPVEVVATSKTAPFFGTTTAAIQYRKFIKTDPKLLIAMALPALIGSMGGASLASLIPTQILKPIVVALLIAVLIYTWKRPQLGLIESMRHGQSQRLRIAAAAALVIVSTMG